MWYPVKTAAIFKWLFPKLLWQIPSKNKPVLYLTFDDGPIPEVTPWVLEQLAKFNAKATFFCIGRNVVQFPEIYQQVINEGHSIGNHTFNHLDGWKTKTADYLKNTAECAEHVNSKLFRPPYGRLKFIQMRQLQKQNYQIVMWDVIAADFDPELSPKKCLANILRFSKNGTILVLHDSKKAQSKLEYVLPQILEHYSALGYEFKSIEYKNPYL
jgi:peptidoglycan/xylan/chitin deacetylase (PgdA/CDA1 family)